MSQEQGKMTSQKYTTKAGSWTLLQLFRGEEAVELDIVDGG